MTQKNKSISNKYKKKINDEVRLDSKVIRKLRDEKITIKEFKKRFGIK